MEEYLRSSASDEIAEADAVAPIGAETAIATAGLPAEQLAQIRAALGGSANIKRMEPIATTRLRVELEDASRSDAQALRNAGVEATVSVKANCLHLIIGINSAQLALSAE
jgi:PTS system glucose-specific IIC component